MKQLVYFIRTVGADSVKIGVSEFPHFRLEQLQKATPHPLELLGLEYGGRAHEKRLHERFADQHLHHEWFTLSGPIADHLVTVNTDTVLCVYPGCPTPATHRPLLCAEHHIPGARSAEDDDRHERREFRAAQRQARRDAVRCIATDCHTTVLGHEFCDAHRPSEVTVRQADPDDPRLQIRKPRPTDWLPNPGLHSTARLLQT